MTIHVIYCEFEQEYINSQCQLLKLTFTFEKTGCVTTVHGEELFVPIVLISSHPFPCHAHLVGRSSHLALICMYVYSYQLQGGVLVFVCFTTFALGMVMFISYSSFM